MKDPQKVIIVLLCISATLLLTVLMVLRRDNTALADAAESRGGDYIMTTGAVTNSQAIVYVIDTQAQRMAGYVLNRDTRTIEMPPGMMVDLAAVFQSGVPQRAPGQVPGAVQGPGGLPRR